MDQSPTPTPEKPDFEAQARKAQENARRLKKRILIVFACMVAFVLVSVPLMNLIDRKSAETTPGGAEAVTRKPSTILFCTPDYDYDIMKDAEYLNLNRYMFYEDLSSGVSVMLDEKTRYTYGPAVTTLTDMIDCIIAGDHEGYNALFSETYLRTHAPEEPFTMQQVYDIRLTRRTVTQISPESGSAYTQYEFIVEYKIHKNNGTFRTDIGLDESRKQVFILTERGSGVAYIEEIRYFTS